MQSWMGRFFILPWPATWRTFRRFTAAAWLTRRAVGGTEPLLPLATRFSYALVPLGFGIWLAHYSFHLLTGLWTWPGAPDLGWIGLSAERVQPLELGFLGLGLVGAGIARAFRQPERYRGKVLGPILGVLSLAVAGAFFMVLLSARQLPSATGAPQVGEKAPDFTLQDSEGRPVRLYSLLEQPGSGGPGVSRSSWVVLIFYRGYW